VSLRTQGRESSTEGNAKAGRTEGGSALKRYGFALLCGALAIVARVLLAHAGYITPYTFFYIAVLFAAWFGGLGPALVAIAIGAVASVSSAVLPRLLPFLPHAPLSGFEFYFIVTLTATILLEAQRRSALQSVRSAALAREAQTQLRITFDYAPVGICRLGAGGVLLDVNSQFCQIAGYSAHQLQRRAYSDILHNEDVPQSVELFRQLWNTGRATYRREERYVCGDGSTIWADVTVSAVRDASGSPLYAIGVAQDITARKTAEEQLRQAQKIESIGALAGGIAHDFNNLLTGILGNATLALETMPRGGTTGRMLQEVITAASRAAQLTAQLLAYAGKGTFVVSDLDISAVVRRSLELIRPSLGSNIELRLALDEDLPPFRADPALVQQLVTNLVINSMEAIGGEAPGEISISTARVQFSANHPPPPASVGQLAPGDYLELRVQDTGMGIEAAQVRKIFDPFFTTKFTGRGLGLAAVSGIVRSHHGGIVVLTVPGQGSVFSVYLPATHESRPTSKRLAAHAEPAGRATS